MSTTKRTCATLTAAAALAAVLSPSDAAAKVETLRYFTQTTELRLVDANGKRAEREPRPGDTIDIYERAFAGDHARHASRPSASAHTRCVMTKAQPDCTAHVAIGGSLLVIDSDLRIVGGAGRFSGATGRVVVKDLPEDTSDSVILVRTQAAAQASSTWRRALYARSVEMNRRAGYWARAGAITARYAAATAQ